jgi:hypothetical protein
MFSLAADLISGGWDRPEFLQAPYWSRKYEQLCVSLTRRELQKRELREAVHEWSLFEQ